MEGPRLTNPNRSLQRNGWHSIDAMRYGACRSARHAGAAAMP